MGEGGKKPAPPSPFLKSVTHILQWWNSTVIPCLKKIQKLYESRDTPLEFYWHQQFFNGNHQVLLYREIHVLIAFRYIMSNFFNFSWVFKDCFNKKVTILTMSAKIATSDLLKIKIFWNKGYDVIIYAYDITKKIFTGFKLGCRCGFVTKVWQV